MELLPTNAYLITEKCGVSQVAPESFSLKRYSGMSAAILRLYGSLMIR